jgi:hypothetical protein
MSASLLFARVITKQKKKIVQTGKGGNKTPPRHVGARFELGFTTNAFSEKLERPGWRTWLSSKLLGEDGRVLALDQELIVVHLPRCAFYCLPAGVPLLDTYVVTNIRLNTELYTCGTVEHTGLPCGVALHKGKRQLSAVYCRNSRTANGNPFIPVRG